MARHRRLRRLVPDEALLSRRAAGETLRALAPDYGVAHTTLGRYFARPAVVEQLRAARRRVRVEQAPRRRELAARSREERRLEREALAEASRQAALEQQRSLARAEAAPPRRRRSLHELWLDARDARQPLTRADLRTRNDERAATVVSAGGDIDAILEATGLGTRANVLRLIDPSILAQALTNEAIARALAQPPQDRLRRLLPDRELIQRRAAGETLRPLAADYRVSHATLSRYLRRPDVHRQLRETRRHLRAQQKASSPRTRGR